MPKVSQEHSDAQRGAILEAAIRCFSKEGFHRTTMRDVVRESGMSAGALYVYFKSKDELIEAIAESRHLREREWITAALDKDDLAASVRALVSVFGRVLTDHEEREERRLAVQLWSEALRNQKVRESVLAGVDEPIELLRIRLKAAQKRGEFPRSLDCRSTARVLVALLQGLVLQLAWDPNVSIPSYAKVVEAMLLALIEKSKETPRG
jgi:AcrR family transcriptional regulator